MGRAGLRASATFLPRETLAVAPYVSASLWREFSPALGADVVNGASGQAVAVRTGRLGSFGQLGAGLQLRSTDDRLTGFVEAEMPFGGRLQGKTVNAGVAMRF